MNIQLLIIDPQKDFCTPEGSLFVNGADEDMTKLAKMVSRLKSKINGIHVTLDSHLAVDVAHPIFWTNSNSEHPDPFTIITKDDVEQGVWSTTLMGLKQRGLDYVTELSNNKRYPLCIWPPHCIIGTNGHTIADDLADALNDWSLTRLRNVNYAVKGSNPFTEHYSVFQADVVDPSDSSTMLNSHLINTINNGDTILVAGEARSHCVANSLRDMIDYLGAEYAKKFILLTDAMSDVTGFENLGEDFIADMENMGMKTSTTTDYLA